MKKYRGIGVLLVRHALAQTTQELIDSGKNSENVTTFGMGLSLNQYSRSPRSTIKRQAPGADLEHEPQQRHGRARAATIYQRVMYVVNGNWTFASDVATGQQIWAHAGGIRARRRARRNPASSSGGGRHL